ncbi:hypothetical protein ACP70R_046894 [Stipagrostis hirtigluma subsp. patula]
MVVAEASILSSIISGTLNLVGNKLAQLIFKEYSSIAGVKKDLQELHGLVEEINIWLETAGDKALGTGPSFSWLNRLKHVSYDVEDLADEFYLEAEEHESDGDGSKNIVSTCLSKPKAFMFQVKAAWKIKAIKKRFAVIVKQRTEFNAIADSLYPVRHINRTNLEMPSLPNADMASVIGRDQEKHKIISKMVETDDQQIIKILSIIGLDVSGKATLANLISKMITYRNMVRKRPECYPLQEMTKTISDKLTGKRFLLVLDDIWTDDRILWGEFMVHLKCGVLPGSCILLTTRSRRIAEVVESAYLFDLPFLSEYDSWQVFEQTFGMAVKGLDTEFLEVGKQIVNKCGGVPLAIKVLAVALHDKKHIEEWQADSNLLDVEGKEHRVFACLRLSYINMPSHLKQCFTICSLFPKGYYMDKEKLIDQWIALGMIAPTDGVNCLEHIGNKYFNSLVQLCFLQDLNKVFTGIVTSRMHDLVHDLAQSILGDEISLVVPKETTASTKSCRYFSLNEESRNHLPKNLYGKARAIYIAKGDNFVFDKALKNAKHLRSMTVEFSKATSVPTAILQIKSLRYLHISDLRCETLPEAISDIWRLQALHVSSSDLLELPESICKLQKLKTLNLAGCKNLKSLPDSIGDCHMISSIDLTGCNRFTRLPNSISENKNLRFLRLGNTSIKRLPPGIATLEKLECLDLAVCQKLVELPEGIGSLKKLEVLNLQQCDKLVGMPVGIGQLTRLQRLDLFIVREGENFAKISELRNVDKIDGELIIRGITCVMVDDANMACLKQKANLKRLMPEWGRNDWGNAERHTAVLDGLEPPSGIEGLHISKYAGGQFARWLLKQAGSASHGVPRFSCLKSMWLYDVPNLKHLQGLVELPCLKELFLEDMPSLESVSGGPFPSLRMLRMTEIPKLEELCVVTESTMADEKGVGCNHSINHLRELHIGNHLSHLSLPGSLKLKVMPYLPSSVVSLSLNNCSGQQLLSLGQDGGCSSDARLLPSLLSFRHLRLKRLYLYGTRSSPSSSSSSASGCGLEVLQPLMTLEFLGIYSFPALLQLPEWVGNLRSLWSLRIQSCPRLSSLHQSLDQLTALQ